MEKICEFCTALKPVVYCKADAAFLCLSCDAKVHSANTLSNRHLRTLLCDSCRNRPAYARCLDHRMFVCYCCDQSVHGGSSPHQKRILTSYTGCPSAKDFAALWGFALDEFGGQQQLFSSSFSTSAQPGKAPFDVRKEAHPSVGSSSRKSKLNYAALVSGVQTEPGYGSKQTEKLCKGQKQPNVGFILQQILDLKKLQLTEMDKSSPVMSSLEETHVSSLFKTSKKHGDSVKNLVQQYQNVDDTDSMLQDSLPFSQPENLPGPATAANLLVGESLWQCKSPVQSGQLWSHNMQDLGVCEDILCHDDFNIPDVDITFRNFEELFGTDQDMTRPLLDEKDASFSSVETDMLLDTSRNRNAEKRMDTSSVHAIQPVYMDKDMGSSDQGFNILGSQDYHQTIQPSYSRSSADISGTEFLDIGISQFVITGGEVSCHSPDLEGLFSEAKEVTRTRKFECRHQVYNPSARF